MDALILIRPATTADVEAIADISRSAHLSGYDTFIDPAAVDQFKRRYDDSAERKARVISKLLRRLNDSEWRYYVATKNGLVVGYACSKVSGEGTSIEGLFVHPHYQGGGIGRLLLRHVLAKVPAPFTLAVIRKNERAVSLYESVGFKRTDMPVKPFYGAEMIRMIRV